MTPTGQAAEEWPGIDGPPHELAEGHGPRYTNALARHVCDCLRWVDAEEAAGRMRPQRARSARRVIAFLAHYVSITEHYGNSELLICTSARRIAEDARLSRQTAQAVLSDLCTDAGPLVRVYKSKNHHMTNAYVFADEP